MRTLIALLAATALSGMAFADNHAKPAEAAPASSPASSPAPAPDLVERTGTIDLATPMGALEAQRKIWCSLNDNETITFYWHGKAFSRRQGERDIHLFDVEGMNIRQCGTVTDPARGDGYKTTSREILLYKDPKTGEVLSKWTNPWTGEVVDVLHVANDPVNGAFYLKNRDGSDLTWSGTVSGPMWWVTFTVPLFYKNELGGDYEAEIGGTYHATEMFGFHGDLAQLTDRSQPIGETHVSWTRISQFLPWMKMGGRDGAIYMHTAGRKLTSFDELSDTMKEQITLHYPEYAEAPPVSDTRKNETSWSYFRKIREGLIEAPKR